MMIGDTELTTEQFASTLAAVLDALERLDDNFDDEPFFDPHVDEATLRDKLRRAPRRVLETYLRLLPIAKTAEEKQKAGVIPLRAAIAAYTRAWVIYRAELD